LVSYSCWKIVQNTLCTPEKFLSRIEDRTFTVAEVAAKTGVHPETARRWVLDAARRGAIKIVAGEWPKQYRRQEAEVESSREGPSGTVLDL
jgi:hypothetical protein